MHLSQKQKSFSRYFFAFFRSALNFERSEKNDDPHRFLVSENTESENVVR